MRSSCTCHEASLLMRRDSQRGALQALEGWRVCPELFLAPWSWVCLGISGCPFWDVCMVLTVVHQGSHSFRYPLLPAMFSYTKMWRSGRAPTSAVIDSLLHWSSSNNFSVVQLSFFKPHKTSRAFLIVLLLTTLAWIAAVSQTLIVLCSFPVQIASPGPSKIGLILEGRKSVCFKTWLSPGELFLWMMNVAGISHTEKGPTLDFVFLCRQECAAKISFFLVQSVKVPSNPIGRML